jgi:hypothetical protein
LFSCALASTFLQDTKTTFEIIFLDKSAEERFYYLMGLGALFPCCQLLGL